MTAKLTPSDLEAAACEYDDRNPHQGVPSRDAAYKGFIDGVRWAEDRAQWVPWASGQRPQKPGYYAVTKASKGRTAGSRSTSAAWWDGSRFLNAANVLAWRAMPAPWEEGVS